MASVFKGVVCGLALVLMAATAGSAQTVIVRPVPTYDPLRIRRDAYLTAEAHRRWAIDRQMQVQEQLRRRVELAAAYRAGVVRGYPSPYVPRRAAKRAYRSWVRHGVDPRHVVSGDFFAYPYSPYAAYPLRPLAPQGVESEPDEYIYEPLPRQAEPLMVPTPAPLPMPEPTPAPAPVEAVPAPVPNGHNGPRGF